jgi:hypothetical protein
VELEAVEMDKAQVVVLKLPEQQILVVVAVVMVHL